MPVAHSKINERCFAGDWDGPSVGLRVGLRVGTDINNILLKIPKTVINYRKLEMGSAAFFDYKSQ